MSNVEDKPLVVVKDSVKSSKAAIDASGPFGDSVLQGANGRGVREDLEPSADAERIERRLSQIDAELGRLNREKLQLLQARVTRGAKRPSAEEKVALASEHELVGDRRAPKPPAKPPKVKEEKADGGKSAEPETPGLGS